MRCRGGWPSLLLATCVLVIGGCERGDRGAEATGAARVAVVASVLPHADIVRRIGGPYVDVVVLVPPGTSPSTYEPTVRELRRVADADLFVAVGHPAFPFERAWLDRLVAESAACEVVSGADGAPHLEGDPHVWLSLPAVRTLARRLRDELAERVPGATPAFDTNLARFLADVDRVDAALAGAAKGNEGRAFYVFHPAFGYIADAYGLEQVAIEEHGKEPAAGYVGRVIDRARASGARVVFVQPQFSAASAEAIADEIGARVVTLDPLPASWVDGMLAIAAGLHEAFAS